MKISTSMILMNMGTTSVTATNSGSGTYKAVFSGGQTFSMAGTWKLVVAVERAGESSVIYTFTVAIGS
jgi:hypothetical protein